MSHVALRWYWLLSGFFKKHFKGLLLGILFGALVVIEGPRLVKYLPIKETSHVGRVGTITLAELPLDIQQKISHGLTRINPDGSTQVVAAQTMTITNDGTTYSFSLNPNMFFSNGVKLSSSDINLNLKDISVNRPSGETISYTLSEPFTPFPVIASQPILKKIETGWPFRKTTIVGLNDYQITRINTVDRFVRSLTLKSKTDVVEYHFFPTETEAVTAFKLGRVDRLEYLANPYLTDWPSVKIDEIKPSRRYLALFFNTTHASLQEKTIRQMLAYATPKDLQKPRIISPIGKESWAYNPQVKPYEYNLDTAQTMLNKLKSANPNFSLSLEITTIPTYADVAQSIVNSWQQLGIEVHQKIVPYPDTNDYQVLLIGQEVPDDPDQYALWHSTQNSNITHYQNPKIDKLLEDGRKEQDHEKRKQVYQDFQRFLLEDCPAAFLYELPLYSLTRK